MILSNSRFTVSNLGGQRYALPTQNYKFRVGKLKSRGGKVKKIGAIALIFSATLFRKRAGAPDWSIIVQRLVPHSTKNQQSYTCSTQ